MHEKGSAPGTKDPSLTSSGKVKEAKIMPNIGHPLAAPSNGPTTIGGAKSTPLRQSKSFNSSKESMIPKPPSSQHELSTTAKSNGASSKLDASTSVVEGGGKTSKLNGAIKSSDAAPVAKPRQISKDHGKLDPKAEALPGNRSERVNSPSSNGTIVKSSSFKVNGESVKKITKQTSFNTSTQSTLPNGKSLSLSLSTDPQKKLPPIKTARAGGAGAKSTSAKNTANLCAECKAELEGAVCFIGNDGRVSACTSRTAVRLCKNLKCANNNPEFVASFTAAIAAPKKYLVSRRHSLNLPRSSSKSSKGMAEKLPAQSSNPNDTTPHTGSDVGAIRANDGGEHECEEIEDMQGELEDDVASLEDMDEAVEIDGIASASPQRGRMKGFHRMRRRSFSVVEKQGAEVVTLKKQMMQERKQAEEWMLDYAIEEALHRLAPSKESKVKALVEAFESVIITPKEAEVVAAAAVVVAEEEGEPSSSTLRTRFTARATPTPALTPTPTPTPNGLKTPKKISL